MSSIHGRAMPRTKFVSWGELNEMFEKKFATTKVRTLDEHMEGYPQSILVNYVARHVRTGSVGLASPIS